MGDYKIILIIALQADLITGELRLCLRTVHQTNAKVFLLISFYQKFRTSSKYTCVENWSNYSINAVENKSHFNLNIHFRPFISRPCWQSMTYIWIIGENDPQSVEKGWSTSH